MKKRKLALLGLTALSLAACGVNGGGNDDGDTPDVETKALTLQIFAGGYGTAPWKKALQLFEEDHPDYDIVVNMDNNVNTQFADRWMQGNPPDFVFFDGTIDRDTWLKEGLIYDLSTWLESAKVAGEDVFIKDKIDNAYFRKYKDRNGKTITYGAPLILTSYGLWYDETLFTDKKWTVPSNFEELKSFADKATAECKTMIYPGNYSGYLTQGFIVPAFAEYGNEFFDRVMNCRDADVYTSNEFKEVLTRFKEFVDLNDNTFADCLSLDHTESQQEWLKRKAALIPNGLWLRSEMDKLHAIPDNFHMRYAPSPLVKSQQTIVTTSVTCGIAKQAKNKKSAKDFLTYLYKDEVLKEFVYASDSPSVADLDLSGDPKVTDVNRYIQSVFNNPKYKHIGNDGSWGGVDTAINQAVNSIVAKTITIEEAINSIKAAAIKEIKDRK